MNFPVFDLHCDTALALLGENLRQAGSLRKNECHIDLERAAVLPGYAQCFACFTTPLGKLPEGVSVNSGSRVKLPIKNTLFIVFPS